MPLHTGKNIYPDFNYSNFYKNKLKYECAIKRKEFNFKMIHNIVSCGEHLFRWGIANERLCSDCFGHYHTVKHMIWECIEVQNLWTKIGGELKIRTPLSYEIIIFGENMDIVVNNVLSLVCYSLYKRFIIKNTLSVTNFVKGELKSTFKLYNEIENFKLIANYIAIVERCL